MPLKFLTHHRLTRVISLLLVAAAVLVALRDVLTTEVFKQESTYASGVPTTTVGPPTIGSHVLNEIWKDVLGGVFKCTVVGTPATWNQILPAAVTADPSSGTIPTGYRVLRVGTGDLKRHAGGYVCLGDPDRLQRQRPDRVLPFDARVRWRAPSLRVALSDAAKRQSRTG